MIQIFPDFNPIFANLRLICFCMVCRNVFIIQAKIMMDLVSVQELVLYPATLLTTSEGSNVHID